MSSLTVDNIQAEAEELLSRLYGLTASSVKEFNSYDDRNFYFRVKESGDSIWPHGYILKVKRRLKLRLISET